MDNIWTKLFRCMFAWVIIVQGIDTLQTLTDLRNALHNRNTLLLPAAPPAAASLSLQPTTVLAKHAEASPSSNPAENTPVPCTCAIFLSGQFSKGQPPHGNPALLHEQEKVYPCTLLGMRQCQNKCLETIIKHLPKSAEILCATIDRDCHKERAYLFVKNCNSTWQNSNLSAGREYCCKDNLPYTCPLI